MCQFEIVLTFCVCPIQIGGGGLSAKYNSATKRFYCAALCLFASPARVEKTNLSGLHPNVNKASAFKAEIFRLDTGWLFKLLPPLFSTKMKNGERANHSRGSLRWRISWNSSFGWLLGMFSFRHWKITLYLVSFLDPCRAILQFFPKCFSTPQHGAQHCRVLYFPGISIIIKNVKYHDNNIKVDIYVWLF